MDMKDKTSEAVDMEKELTSEIDMTNENELTSEYLKKTTTIKTRSWLSFFLFQVFVGGLISLIYPIVTFKIGGLWRKLYSGYVRYIYWYIVVYPCHTDIKGFQQQKKKCCFPWSFVYDYMCSF